MDILDIQMQQKKFFKAIYGGDMDLQFKDKSLKANYGGIVGAGGKLKDSQYIRIYQTSGDDGKVVFFNDIDELVKHTSTKVYGTNTYFTLSTTNGSSGKETDLIHRSVLAFDFDKKDLGENFTHKDILQRFKDNNIWYHALIDSGHGYHAYICIEPTQDTKKVVEVTKAIGERLGADPQAMKSTQILRVPLTYNVKREPKRVNIINKFDNDTIKRYDIDRLYKRFCNKSDIGSKATEYAVANTNIPGCIQEILSNGSIEGKRYADLQKIVVSLRNRNKSIKEIKAICKEWAYKSNYNDNVLYRVDYIYNNLKYVSMDCKSCKDKGECFNNTVSNFEYPKDFKVLTMSETHSSKLKCSKRKGARQMHSNDILVYGILKNNGDGLFREEIIKELTYKKKCILSDKTLTKALQSLEDNEFIEVTGKPKFYRLKDIRSKIELTYNISYAATYEAVKGHISTEELRLYNYMRYLHNKQQREDPKALKGNLFQFNQAELANDLGLTQGRISQMINNLLDEMLLGVWYRQPSRNNGFDYYIYRLNY